MRALISWTMVCGALLVLMPRATVAQAPPSVNQEETPYVPTPQNVVDKMLEIASVRATDFVMDLGSGDGRIVITAAAKYGARALGVDYDGYLIKQSRANAAKAGVGHRVRFLQKDINEVDFSPATVLTMYLLPEFNLELRPKILAQLRPGARVVSHDWGMGDWEPDAKHEVPAPEKIVGVSKSSTIYFWIVPARVAGRWHSRIVLEGRVARLDLNVNQRFQQLEGTATIDGVNLDLASGRVSGQLVSFRFMHAGRDVRFEGQLENNRIVGKVMVPNGRPERWRAVRTKPAVLIPAMRDDLHRGVAVAEGPRPRTGDGWGGRRLARLEAPRRCLIAQRSGPSARTWARCPLRAGTAGTRGLGTAPACGHRVCRGAGIGPGDAQNARALRSDDRDRVDRGS